MNNDIFGVGLQPSGQDRAGLKWSKHGVSEVIVNEIKSGNDFQKRSVNNMRDNIKEAAETIEELTSLFENQIQNLTNKKKKIEESCKSVSSSVRDSANKLGDGLIRVEKMADFNKLERYVDLLERAASAFNQLAELEKTGKLEKIALAIK
jgi:TolA-binding protein